MEGSQKANEASKGLLLMGTMNGHYMLDMLDKKVRFCERLQFPPNASFVAYDIVIYCYILRNGFASARKIEKPFSHSNGNNNMALFMEQYRKALCERSFPPNPAFVAYDVVVRC